MDSRKGSSDVKSGQERIGQLTIFCPLPNETKIDPCIGRLVMSRACGSHTRELKSNLQHSEVERLWDHGKYIHIGLCP